MHEYKVGDWVCETWRASPDKTKAYQIIQIENDLIHYSRVGIAYVNAIQLRPALPHEIPIEFRPKISKQQKENILNLIKSI